MLKVLVTMMATSKYYWVVVSLLLYFPYAMAQNNDVDINKRALTALNYPQVLLANLSTGCLDVNVNRALAQLCNHLTQIPHEVIIEIAAKHFQQVVAKEHAEKLVDFWESNDGIRISNALVLELTSGQHNVLTTSDLMILDKVNQTPESQAAAKFAENNYMAAQIINELEAYLAQQ